MIESELSENWQIINLGNKNYFSIESGGTPKTNEPAFWNGNIDWATLADLPQDYSINFIKTTNRKITTVGLQKSSAKLIPKQSVVLSSRATIGRIAINEIELSTNQGFKNIVINVPHLIYNKFVAYNLLCRKNELINISKGTTFKELSKTNLESLNILLPPINKQKQIVAKIERLFSELDDGVNILHMLKQQIKVLRQSILKAAFSGKLTGSYVSDDELPEGWQLSAIKDLPLRIIDGDRGKNYPKQSDFTTSGYCVFLNTKNVTASGFDFTNVMFITEYKDNQLRNGKLNRGDIVLTTRGTLGNTAYYDDIIDYPNLRINSGMVMLRVDSSQINQRFLCYFIKSIYFSAQVSKFKTGTAQPQLPINILNKFQIIIPNTVGVQKQIVAKIEELFATCDELDQTTDNALNQAQLLRQSILKQAFSGKLI